MLITVPAVGIPTTETQYSKLARNYCQAGLIGTPGDGTLKIKALSNGLYVYPQAGQGIVRGFHLENTTVAPLPIEVGDPDHPRIDRIAYRLYQTSTEGKQQGEFVVIKGTPSVAPTPPNYIQTDTDIYDLPLAAVRVAQNAVTITQADVTDERVFIGIWQDASKRPTLPNGGQTGYNLSTESVEIWNGEKWVSINTKPPSFTDNGGSVTLPNGLIIKYGTVNPEGLIQTSPSRQRQSFNFPTPFPNKCFSVQLTASEIAAVGGEFAILWEFSKIGWSEDYGFESGETTQTSTTTHYMAIGF